MFVVDGSWYFNFMRLYWNKVGGGGGNKKRCLIVNMWIENIRKVWVR